MLSPFVKLYVYNALRRKKIKELYNENLLNREIALFSSWPGKIRYAWFWSAGTHVPNASATIPGIILVNAEWAVKIILENDNPIMHDAFSMTINHEITHHENDYSFFDLFTPDGQFVNWINEVHADYGGILKAFDGLSEQALSAMQYKLACKKRPDKDTRSHPSWKRRMDYIVKYDFNEKLIEQIAIDCGCTNEKLINAIRIHFEDIVLRR